MVVHWWLLLSGGGQQASNQDNHHHNNIELPHHHQQQQQQQFEQLLESSSVRLLLSSSLGFPADIQKWLLAFIIVVAATAVIIVVLSRTTSSSSSSFRSFFPLIFANREMATLSSPPIDGPKDVMTSDSTAAAGGGDTTTSSSTSCVFDTAEKYKLIGNQLFKEHHFEAAANAYSRAVALCEDEEESTVPNLHIYLTNRAFCNLKLENYGLVILDADRAIELVPSFCKAYYRRGCAHAALNKLSNALKDFQFAHRIKPDPDTAAKIKECQKQIKQIKFAKAISEESKKPLSETIDLTQYEGSLSSYKGPRYSKTPQFLSEVLEYLKTPGNLLHKRDVFQMVCDTIEILKKVDTVVDITVGPTEEFTVCGDIHGQFYDLLNIFKINGLPSETNPYLFNGDFVDRGSFSVECILALIAAKLAYPNHVHLARGNHETRGMNKLYGFQGEIVHKYDATLYELFCECFCWLPLGHTINRKVFIVHGGLFAKDGIKISDIKKVDRNREPGDDGIMTELLWSDPQPGMGRMPSKRGVACSFGPDVTKQFLQDNNLEYVIRSHEMKEEGHSFEHDDQLITVFSAPNYCDSMGNKGAFLRLRGDTLKPNVTVFEAVPHPAVRPMQYANPLLGLMG